MTEFKKGDKVRVTRKELPTDFTDVWVPCMDKWIGETAEVIGVVSGLVRLENRNLEGGACWFPPGCLEKIEEEVEEEDKTESDFVPFTEADFQAALDSLTEEQRDSLTSDCSPDGSVFCVSKTQMNIIMDQLYYTGNHDRCTHDLIVGHRTDLGRDDLIEIYRERKDAKPLSSPLFLYFLLYLFNLFHATILCSS